MTRERTDVERAAGEAMIRAALLRAPMPPVEEEDFDRSEWVEASGNSLRYVGEERYFEHLRKAYGSPAREIGAAMWFDNPRCDAAPTDSEGEE